jgi:hypothetical protein
MCPTKGSNMVLFGDKNMQNEKLRELHAPVTAHVGGATVEARAEAAHHQYRLIATMVQGTAATLPEAWQSYRSTDEARTGAREMLHNHRVLRVAIVEDRIPLQFVEWIGR